MNGETPSREDLWAIQTPQGFDFQTILEAHQDALKNKACATDDTMLVSELGHQIKFVQGHKKNIKITTKQDFEMVNALMDTIICTGHGFDVHAFDVNKDHVIFCGYKIPHKAGLSGHSDADVGLHALCDAIYGACGNGDIGYHFPPTDPQWKNANSRTFLIHALNLINEQNGTLMHVDITMIGEAPKLGPHREAILDVLEELLPLPRTRIGLKATTTEKLGFTGRQEGLAAQTTVTIRF